MRLRFPLCLALLLPFAGFAQQKEVRLLYAAERVLLPGKGEATRLLPEQGYADVKQGGNPVVRLVLPGSLAAYKLQKPVYAPLAVAERLQIDSTYINTNAQPTVRVARANAGRTPMTVVEFSPLRRNPLTKQLERLAAYTPVTTSLVGARQAAADSVPARQGLLASGTVAKIGVTASGVYKLTAADLQRLGFATASINPANIHIYGYGGKALPEIAGASRPDPMTDNALYITGEGDGRLDNGDAVYFYANGPVQWAGKRGCGYAHIPNIYADTGYYLVTVNGTPSPRIAQAPAPANVDTVFNTYLDHQVYDKDNINLLKSGRVWFADALDLTPGKQIDFPAAGLVAGTPVQIGYGLAAASIGINTTWTIKLADATVATVPIQATSSYAFAMKVNDSYGCASGTATGGDPLSVTLAYNKSGNEAAVGYLDYIWVNMRRTLAVYDGQTRFRVPEAANVGVAGYSIAPGAANVTVWNVSHTGAPVQMATTGNATTFFADSGGAAREYVAFDQSAVPSAILAGPVPNQDIVSGPAPEVLIITPDALFTQAQALADHRRTADGLTVKVVSPRQIYNEFSSGQQDLSALRDYNRYLFRRNGSAFKYVVLMGDCSFDYKFRTSGNTNMVPTYETYESSDPILSQASDDYIAMLDDAEGLFGYNDLVDVGVGRLPVANTTQATDVVTKLIHYNADTVCLGPWRVGAGFVSDNGDALIHMRQADGISHQVENQEPGYWIHKYYLPAYPLVTGPGGLTSTLIREAISRQLRDGTFSWNYTGHGSEYQWADEKIFDPEMITGLDNYDKLPFFVTATCEFGKLDDPAITSSAEQLVLKKDGGAIGIVSACRPVNSGSNAELNAEFYKHFYERDTATTQMLRLGDIFARTKNLNSSRSSNIPFILFADPSMRLAYPLHEVVANSLTNGAGQPIDTIKALETVTLSGQVRTRSHQVINNYKGVVQIYLFDKPSTINVVDNSSGTTILGSFTERRSVIFSGSARVVNGAWGITFQVPLDINYAFGSGKMIFYAQPDRGLEDAAGYDVDSLTVGGSVTAALDDTPPKIRLFMNDTTFADGGIVSPSPTFIAKLADNTGINVSLSGIGHEMTGVFSYSPKEPQVMNQFYTADLGKPAQGQVVFPMQGLAPGSYSVKFTAWDLQNNSATSTLNFKVQAANCLTLSKASLTPNPVFDKADFSVETDHPGEPLTVNVRVFDIAGRDLGQLSYRYEAAPARIGDENLRWTTGTLNGHPVGNGLYFYRITGVTDAGCQASLTGRMAVQR